MPNAIENWALRRRTRDVTGETPESKRQTMAEDDTKVAVVEDIAKMTLDDQKTAEDGDGEGQTATGHAYKRGNEGTGKGTQELLDTTARLTRALADQVRELNVATFEVLLLGAKDQLVEQMDVAGKSYHDATKGRSPHEHKMGPPSVHLFVALLTELNNQASKSGHKELQYALAAIDQHLNEEGVEKVVRVCKLTKAYDKKKIKLTLATTERSVQVTITKALDKLGLGQPLYGKAPRGGLERSLNSLLR